MTDSKPNFIIMPHDQLVCNTLSSSPWDGLIMILFFLSINATWKKYCNLSCSCIQL